MKVYNRKNFLIPTTNMYNNSEILQRISELDESLIKKFRENAEKEYQSVEFAKKFVVY